MSPLDLLGLLGLLAGAAAVFATLFVKGKSKAVASNWEGVATSATARAAEATVRADALQLRVDHLEQQVRVLVDTITAKESIDALERKVDARFDDLTKLVVEAMVTSGVPRAPASARRPA